VTELYGEEYNAVLFDLDGTLVDTAPDMVTVLQHLQQERGIEPAAYDSPTLLSSSATTFIKNIWSDMPR